MCVPTESACVFEEAAAATVEFGTKRVEMAVGGKKGRPGGPEVGSAGGEEKATHIATVVRPPRGMDEYISEKLRESSMVIHRYVTQPQGEMCPAVRLCVLGAE